MSGVRFDVPAEVAFDYLVDPLNRSAWQSSLRRVEDLSGPTPAVGQCWIDVTVPGPRPRLETTVLDRPERWTECGSWRGLAAELTLSFSPAGTGCVVTAEASFSGRAAVAGLRQMLALAAPLAIRSDLRRAARLLSR